MLPPLFPWEQEIHRRQQPVPVSQQNPNPARRWEVSGKEEQHQSTLQYPPAKKNSGTHLLALWWFTSAARGVFHVFINCLQEAFGKLHRHLPPWCIPLKSVFLSPTPTSLGGSYSVQLFFHSAFPLDWQYLHNTFGGKELLKYSFCFNDRTAYAVTPPGIFWVVIMLSTYLSTVFFHQGSLCSDAPTSFSFGRGGCKQGSWKPKRYRLQLRQELVRDGNRPKKLDPKINLRLWA